MARVMIIAGGTWQCPIVKLAKNKGHFVICTNMYEESPAFEYADVGLVANVLDKEKNLEYAEIYKPDIVLTEQSDIAVPTVAYVAEKMGLKGIGIDLAKLFTNKYLMRKFVSQAGFASPKYKLCHTIDEAKDFLKVVPTCIIKPIDSQSSRGVHIIKTPKEIDEYFADCIQYSNDEKAIIIEEYIDGTEFTVDGIKTSTEYVVTAISEKEHYEYNSSVAKRLVFSHKNEYFDYDQLRQINTEIVKSMGLPFGITHAEYKYKNGDFYLIEIAARGGGTKISSDIVPLVSGINSNEIYLNILVGGSENIIIQQHYAYAILGFFDFPSGIVKSISGTSEAQKQLGVYDLELEIKVGDHIGQAKDDRSRCGYYIVYADAMDELNKREKLLKDTIKVVVE